MSRLVRHRDATVDGILMPPVTRLVVASRWGLGVGLWLCEETCRRRLVVVGCRLCVAWFVVEPHFEL
jgi:hypothetical protein